MAETTHERPAATFFTEEATRQILTRISNVFDDPDLCDATFIVGDNNEKEEISAPSQFMALSSPYFKKLFYPVTESKRREITGIHPQVFRKVLDYLFKGRVPLSSIEDAWKVKVAGRKFMLEELEELVTKFLKYRLDGTNLLTYLRNSTKYEAPDLREVILNRFAKEADTVLDDESMLDLSQDDLTSLMQKQPICPAKKVVDVLIRWSRKRHNLDPSPSPAKRVCIENDGNATSGEQTANNIEDKSQPEQEIDLVKSLEPFIKHVRWENKDADYFLKSVHGHKIMTEENENTVMANMLQSFIDNQPLARIPLKRGRQPGSGRGRAGRGTHQGVGRGIAHHNVGEFEVVMEKYSSHRGRGGIIKTEPPSHL